MRVPLRISMIACFIAGCNHSSPAENPDAQEIADAGVQEALRFHLDVSNDVPESIYVQLNREDGQATWVTVTHASSGQRVYLNERCEIRDCNGEGGVCGAALPLVRDITAGTHTGSIELTWNREISAIDQVSGCEERVAAPAGEYIAKFCWAQAADIDSGDPTALTGAPGEIRMPTCTKVDFTLPAATDVGFVLAGG